MLTSGEAANVQRAQAQQASAIGLMNRNTYDTDLRFRCMDLAIRDPNSGGDALRHAQAIYNFVTGKDERNVRTTVIDALNQAGVD